MQQLIHYAVNSPLGIIGWSLIALLVFFWLIRSSPKLLGAIVLLIVLALLAHAAVERMERAATAAVDNATNTVSNAVPDWAKRLWQKVKRPFGNFGESKLCDYAGIKTICDWYDALAEIRKPLEQQAKDEQDIEEICKASAAVEARFPDAAKTMFCAGNPFKRTHTAITSIGEGIEQAAQQAVLSKISSFLVLDSENKLDTQQYTGCLYTQIAASRIMDCDTYRAKLHEWRLCAEFHLQLPHETIGGNSASAPLDPHILACRKQAYGIQ